MMPQTRRLPLTLDYTNRYWGHDYTITNMSDDGQCIGLMGWGPIPREGDFLILQNGSSSTRYRVVSTLPINDPQDMWHVSEAVFSPR